MSHLTMAALHQQTLEIPVEPIVIVDLVEIHRYLAAKL